MSSHRSTRTTDLPSRSLASSSSPTATTTGITIYGCDPDEAILFRELAPHFGVALTITEEAASAANADLATGNRCVSTGHKAQVSKAALHALGQAGVDYLSTRSVGCDHIDVAYAESVGIRVANVAYSPDSVADYTLMLMLMSLRHAKATIRRTDGHDYRLPESRGRELRDLTVGVIGTGRIGAAVVDRLRGFGCQVLAHDTCSRTSPVDYTPLDHLLRHSDIVTLHTPLTPQTHHLLDGQRIQRLKQGAIVVNTGRGPLLDTKALLSALENGHLGGAALDVLEGEECTFYDDWRGRRLRNEALSRLQEMPSVLISPHSAYYTDHALHDTVENTLINCLTFEKEKSA